MEEERLSYTSGAHVFTPCFSGVRAAQSIVFCVFFLYRSLFVFLSFLLAVSLPVRLQFMASYCLFGILYL